VRRRVVVEKAEVLPEPAHVRLARWRASVEEIIKTTARTAGVPEAEPVSWMTEYRTARDAEQSAITRRLLDERAALRKALEPVVDARYLRATRALALVEDETVEAVA
jgi:hypothetical protein